MYIKIHKTKDNALVAVCDEDLIGKKFEEGNLFLDVSESFYKGEIKSKDEIKKILKDSNNINFVGEESVNLGLELGLIDKHNILIIEGVKHAQFCQ